MPPLLRTVRNGTTLVESGRLGVGIRPQLSRGDPGVRQIMLPLELRIEAKELPLIPFEGGWDSCKHGARRRHAPLRLTVVLHARREDIERAVHRNQAVRDLVEGHWLEIFCVTASGVEKIECGARFEGSEGTEALLVRQEP